MAKKKKAEEHENLERWLVSYADFMTLLFATFVVLYALAQSDVNAFKNIEESLKRAFSQNIFDNQASIMDGSDSMLDGQQGAINPLMLEYMSQKYEQESYEEIKEDIENLKADVFTAEMCDKGLIIRMNDKAIKFVPASAEIEKDSIPLLNEIAKIIKERFSIHYIEVEGHTDSDGISNEKFPSNWELSSARASSVVRYLIRTNGFNPKIFSAVGLADTVPIAPNISAANKAKNRRVEIVIVKNKYKDLSKKDMQKILKEVKNQQNKKIIKKSHSDAVEGLVGKDKELLKNVIDMSDQYSSEVERLNSLGDDEYIFDGLKPEFIKNDAERK